jgi:hypothetical protein
MRQFLILAGVLALIAGDARAQIKPIKPIAPIGAPTTPHVDTFKPYQPPASSSVYADGAFSPAGEARRQRHENAAPAGGPFSPEAEAKRRKDQEKVFHPF